MKLYVGNLPPSFTDEELKELFLPFGEPVSSKIIIDRETGRSKGFGFVEMNSKEEATNAINELNGKVIGKSPIVVDESRPPKRRDNAPPFKKRFR